MSKMFQLYGVGQALFGVLPPPLGFQNPPNSNQTNYEIGQMVYSPPLAPTSFYLYAGAGNWVEFASTGALVVPGSITATSGNITATNGNFVALAAGDGIVLNSGTASGTTAATLNGRSGQLTITTPSIAAGATFTYTVTNSAVTASTTQIIYALVGGTTGSALTIQSVTNSAGQSVVVLQNGTGATTNTASLTLTFLMLN